MCSSVQKRAFYTLFCILIHLVFKKFKKKNFKLILKKSFLNNLIIFHPMNSNIVYKPVIFNRKEFKMQRYSSVTVHFSPKTPISEGSKKITSIKIQILPLKKFLARFGPKTTEPICFQKFCMTYQLKLIIPKKCGFQS